MNSFDHDRWTWAIIAFAVLFFCAGFGIKVYASMSVF
jgi:hypothetical protein